MHLIWLFLEILNVKLCVKTVFWSFLVSVQFLVVL